MKAITLFTILATALLAQVAVAQDLNIPPTTAEFVPNQLIVKFNPAAAPNEVAQAKAQNGAREIRGLFNGYKLLRLPAGNNPLAAAKRFKKNPVVQAAYPDYLAYALASASDPLYGYQWHFDNINLESAWDVTTGSSSVIVAVLDTGLSTAGEDTPENENLVPGYDFAYGDSDTHDGNRHGTHVSGTIAQATNNGLGVAGMAPGVSLMPVKVLDDNGSGATSIIAAGIVFAADNGARVINMSLGYPAGYTPPDAEYNLLLDAIIHAINKGVIIIAASGNDSARDAIGYPAAYPEVVAVGATDFGNRVTRYSNKGPGLDICAPGGDTSRDKNRDGYPDGVLQETFDSDGNFGYFFFQGTSMATPHVAAAAGLVLSANECLSPAQVRQILTSTATDLGDAGYDTSYGYGLLNVSAAVQAALTTQCSTPTPTCTDDADCDDTIACTLDACTAGVCTHTTQDAMCDNGLGLFCDGEEVCSATEGCVSTGDPCTHLCDDTLDACVECLSATDCNDGESCSDDSCKAGTCDSTWAVCSMTPDGCCAPDCSFETDADCVSEPVCGDGVCEGSVLGETCGSCKADCPRVRSNCCGDYTCGPLESAASCPIDCL